MIAPYLPEFVLYKGAVAYALFVVPAAGGCVKVVGKEPCVTGLVLYMPVFCSALFQRVLLFGILYLNSNSAWLAVAVCVGDIYIERRVVGEIILNGFGVVFYLQSKEAVPFF